jgi:hypothetical protein
MCRFRRTVRSISVALNADPELEAVRHGAASATEEGDFRALHGRWRATVLRALWRAMKPPQVVRARPSRPPQDPTLSPVAHWLG